MTKKNILTILVIILTNTICLPQTAWVITPQFFGETQEELMTTWLEPNTVFQTTFNFKLYERKANEIIFTYFLDCGPHDDLDGNSILTVKATCYFKNDIFYKVKQEMRSNIPERRQMESGNDIFYRMIKKDLEKRWYTEDKINCADVKNGYGSCFSHPDEIWQLRCENCFGENSKLVIIVETNK